MKTEMNMSGLAVMVCGMLINSIAWSLPIVSDSFNRPDNATTLGATDQGYVWQVINWYGTHDWCPGIKNGKLWWQAADWNRNNPVCLSEAATNLKNFTLEADIALVSGAARGITLHFRVPKSQIVDSGGAAGYGVGLQRTDLTHIVVTLYNPNYGISQTATVVTGGPDIHAAILAEENRIRVFINQSSTPAIDFTDTTANPGKNAAGYFAFWNGNATDAQGIDNLTIVRRPSTSGVRGALVSDSFSRADAPKELGRTDQGYAWSRIAFGDPSAEYNPGIKNDRLWFEPGDWNKNDAATLSNVPPLKNFTLEYDYVTLEADGASRAIGAYIRAPLNQLPNDQANIAGYTVYVRQVDATTVRVSLANASYGIAPVCDVQTGGLGCHVKVTAEGNTIRVYIDNAAVPAIDYTDLTANPGKETAGYISFYGGNSPDRQGIDHLVVIPRAGLVSDSFNRPDSTKSLGRTDQGFAWSRLQWGDPNATNNPGIKNGRLWFEPGDWNKNDVVTLPDLPTLKDFTLEYDYITLEEAGASRAIGAFIRSPQWQVPHEQSNVPGYAIYVKQHNYSTITVSLVNGSYGINQSVNVTTGEPGCRVKVAAEGRNIRVYINNAAAPAIDFTDTTANPGKDAAGYLSFYGSNSSDRQGIDHLTVTPKTTNAAFAGWYDHLTWTTLLPDAIAEAGGSEVVLYASQDPIEKIQTYLDNAVAGGIRIVIGLDELVESYEIDAVTAKVDAFKNHPALGGWYIFDEPWDNDKISHCQTTADIIRTRSDKPIYICYSGGGLDLNLTYTYRNTYDIMMFDYYPFNVGDGEFYRLETWKRLCDLARDKAQAAGKPLYMVIQGVGKVPYWADTFRLPTYREDRFMVFYSFFNNARAIEFWAEYSRQMTIAIPTDPYPFDGNQWREEVGKPLMQEINLTGAAIGAGPIAGGVSGSNATIRTNVYLDPLTGQYHLIAVNSSNSDQGTTFTLNLPVELIAATPIHVPVFDDQSRRPIQARTFSDTLSPYDVHHYILEPDLGGLSLPGDANGDTRVDVGDLGILAANYGTTANATRAMGDFNGDAKVDVGDLGILAAHYGTGTGGTLDFNADAGTLGLTLDDREMEKADTLAASVPGCGSTGLPLIGGVILAGLMRVKLEP